MKERPRYYILEGKEIKPVSDVMEWSMWFEKNKEAKIVAQQNIGDVFISTVFLGLDHAWSGEPEIFETMIFGGENDQYCERYATREQAEEGHRKACELVVA